MPAKDAIEITVNIIITLGFIVFAAGIGIWVHSLCTRLNLSFEAMLIVFGLIILILGLIAAKLFSKVVG